MAGYPSRLGCLTAPWPSVGQSLDSHSAPLHVFASIAEHSDLLRDQPLPPLPTRVTPNQPSRDQDGPGTLLPSSSPLIRRKRYTPLPLGIPICALGIPSLQKNHVGFHTIHVGVHPEACFGS